MKKKINSRTKGHTAERKLVKLFEAWWGTKFFRTPGSGAFATRGFAGMDLTDMSGDIITTDTSFPFCVESKKVEGWTLEQMLTSNKTKMHSWWEQTAKESPKGKIPLLVFTKNHTPLYGMMYVEDAERHTMTSSAFPHVKNSFTYYFANKSIIVCIFSMDVFFSIPKDSWRSLTKTK